MNTENKKVRIIIDSAADLKEEIRDKFTILPMKICFGDTEYTSGVDIDNTQFYEKLIESDELPVTSQIKPFDYKEAFDEAEAAGESVVVIALSSKLSGTYQSAVMASSESNAEVYVVDSMNVAIGIGILAEYALELKEKGMSAKDIADALEKEKGRVRVVALLNTLEYLKKGGRISRATAFAGELMSIKPVVAISDGEVKMLGKARGSRQGNNLLVKEIEAAGGVDFKKPLLLGYAGLSDTMLDKYVEDSQELWEPYGKRPEKSIIGSVVGTHIGPGAIAVAFFSKEA